MSAIRSYNGFRSPAASSLFRPWFSLLSVVKQAGSSSSASFGLRETSCASAVRETLRPSASVRQHGRNLHNAPNFWRLHGAGGGSILAQRQVSARLSARRLILGSVLMPIAAGVRGSPARVPDGLWQTAKSIETNRAGTRTCPLIVPSSLLKSQCSSGDLVLANDN